jgi:SAM-dependent methyltransferase
VTDTVYDRLGTGYPGQRQPDPHWQRAINEALGSAGTVVNIGAGTGSYEPVDRYVLAVEPSTTMIRQRSRAAAPALQAAAERLPVADQQFDLAMALVTIHHWTDWPAGLREMQRVARRVVVLHFDPVLHSEFWLVRDYLPELSAVWESVPRPGEVAALLGTGTEVRELPVPADCVDGFLPANWRRPQAYLQAQVRQSMSGLRLLAPDVLSRGITALAADLEDGTWEKRNAALLQKQTLDVGWRLLLTPEVAGDPSPKGLWLDEGHLAWFMPVDARSRASKQPRAGSERPDLRLQQRRKGCTAGTVPGTGSCNRCTRRGRPGSGVISAIRPSISLRQAQLTLVKSRLVGALSAGRLANAA